MTERNPVPAQLSHLDQLRRSGVVDGLRQAALWVADSKRTMQPESIEARWAEGARQFLWQLADERAGVAPWSTDLHTAKQSERPVMVGKRGSKLMALAIFSGHAWRYADTLAEVCFSVDVWQPLPRPPP